MNKLGWGFAVFFALLSGAMAFKFIVVGSTGPSQDGRTAIVLTAKERDLVLEEMRNFLESVGEITAGLQTGDMKKVQSAASAVGMKIMNATPLTLRAKMPLGFKKLGHSTHQKFDALAQTASELPKTEEILGQLAAILENCTGCHAGYKISITP